jgi:hypothetical protein
MYSRTLFLVGAHWSRVEVIDEARARANIKENLRKVGQRIRSGQVKPPPDPPDEPTALIAVDLDQKMWMTRRNPDVVRALLSTISGTADSDGVNVTLWSDSGSDTKGNRLKGRDHDPAIFVNYFSNGHPRSRGVAYKGQHPQNPNLAALTTPYERHDDPSMMTPLERMAEMLDRACHSPKLMARFKEEFNGMLDPRILIPLAGMFLATFGAQAVGGAAAAMAVGRLMGINQMLCDLYFYEPRARELYRICYGDKVIPRNLDEGADLLEDIIVQLITDLANAVGIQSLVAIAGKLLKFLINVLPDSVVAQAERLKGVAGNYIETKGYFRRDRLKPGHDALIEPAADRSFREKSVEHREAIVVREPDTKRLNWVTSHIWNRQKPTWLKAKSKFGWNGLVCVLESEVTKGGALKRAKTTYKPGNLKGVTKEIDADLAKMGERPMYEMPTDGRPIDGIDYSYTGKGNANITGHYLVDMGEGRMMIVDSMGNPYIADIDVVAHQRPGKEFAGSHLHDKGSKTRKHEEDDFMLEYDLNRSYHRNGEVTPLSDHSQHGGGGAAVVHVRVAQLNNQKHWSPRLANGQFAPERLVVYLPEYVPGKGIVSNRYIFNNWDDYQQFALANGWEFPF